jgi:parallel beta-helix repeat protein
VHNGTYYESIVVNKEIDIIGENKSNTILDGSRANNTIHVNSENVTISCFTICNSSREKNKWYIAGIRLTGSNNIIHGNIIKGNMLGIFGKKVTNTTIYDNQFFGDGIVFSLYDNEEMPVPYLNKYFLHNIYNNEVNNKTIYYLRNQDDIKVPNDAGQIIAVNCIRITIRDANLDNADFGCILVNCSDCVIEYSSISYSDGLLWLIHSMKNLIQNNKISYNFEGICLDSNSRRNIIQYNNISYNEVCGTIIEDGSNFNKISRNNFIKNCLNAPQLQTYFKFCFYNRWKKNYWDGPRLLPKAIRGRIGNTVPWINFDWNPAQEPYDI